MVSAGGISWQAIYRFTHRTSFFSCGSTGSIFWAGKSYGARNLRPIYEEMFRKFSHRMFCPVFMVHNGIE